MTIGAGWYLVHEIFAAFTRITEKAEGGRRRGNPHIQKTISSLSCSWIKKLREWGREWGTGEGRGRACWCLSPEKLIVGSKQWLWTWIPDASSLSQPCNRLMTHWEPFIHFYFFPPTTSSFRKQWWISPPSPRPKLSWSPTEGVPQNRLVAARYQHEVQRSQSVVLKL